MIFCFLVHVTLASGPTCGDVKAMYNQQVCCGNAAKVVDNAALTTLLSSSDVTIQSSPSAMPPSPPASPDTPLSQLKSECTGFNAPNIAMPCDDIVCTPDQWLLLLHVNARISADHIIETSPTSPTSSTLNPACSADDDAIGVTNTTIHLGASVAGPDAAGAPMGPLYGIFGMQLKKFLHDWSLANRMAIGNRTVDVELMFHHQTGTEEDFQAHAAHFSATKLNVITQSQDASAYQRELYKSSCTPNYFTWTDLDNNDPDFYLTSGIFVAENRNAQVVAADILETFGAGVTIVALVDISDSKFVDGYNYFSSITPNGAFRQNITQPPQSSWYGPGSTIQSYNNEIRKAHDDNSCDSVTCVLVAFGGGTLCSNLFSALQVSEADSKWATIFAPGTCTTIRTYMPSRPTSTPIKIALSTDPEHPTRAPFLAYAVNEAKMFSNSEFNTFGLGPLDYDLQDGLIKWTITGLSEYAMKYTFVIAQALMTAHMLPGGISRSNFALASTNMQHSSPYSIQNVPTYTNGMCRQNLAKRIGVFEVTPRDTWKLTRTF